MKKHDAKVGLGSALALGVVIALVPAHSAGAIEASSTPVATVQQAASSEYNGLILPQCSGCGYGTTVTRLGSTRFNNRHVRDLSGYWSKASSYTWSQTVSVTASLSTNLGVSASAVSSAVNATYSTSRGYSVGAVISASPSRESKLAVKADFNRVQVRVVKKMQGITTSNKTGYLWSPVAGTAGVYVRYR